MEVKFDLSFFNHQYFLLFYIYITHIILLIHGYWHIIYHSNKGFAVYISPKCIIFFGKHLYLNLK